MDEDLIRDVSKQGNFFLAYPRIEFEQYMIILDALRYM